MSIAKGDTVRWKWGGGYAEGKVENTFTKTTTRTIKGSEITRHGTDENKALFIKQEDGDRVLKLESEVEKT